MAETKQPPPPGGEPREELLRIVRSLKDRILESRRREAGAPPIFFMRGATEERPEPRRRAAEGTDRPAPAGSSRVLSLEDVRRELGECTRCHLHLTRRNLVFGEGNPRARLVFIGEAPGEEEDRQGRPFVGRAGQLLTKIIQAMGLRREDVYICNILKCRPPQNRNPRPDEMQTCEPFLIRQVEAIRPKAICALGSFAAKRLLGTDVPITVLRGKFHELRGVQVMPTYHPAYLLRNPDAKKHVWEDVQLIMNILQA